MLEEGTKASCSLNALDSEMSGPGWSYLVRVNCVIMCYAFYDKTLSSASLQVLKCLNGSLSILYLYITLLWNTPSCMTQLISCLWLPYHSSQTQYYLLLFKNFLKFKISQLDADFLKVLSKNSTLPCGFCLTLVALTTSSLKDYPRASLKGDE